MAAYSPQSSIVLMKQFVASSVSCGVRKLIFNCNFSHTSSREISQLIFLLYSDGFEVLLVVVVLVVAITGV